MAEPTGSAAETAQPRRPRILRGIPARITAGAVAIVAAVLAADSVGVVLALDRMLAGGVAATLEQDVAGLSADAANDDLVALDVLRINDDERLVRLEEPSGTVVNDEGAALLPSPEPGEQVRALVDGEPYLVASFTVDEQTVVIARSLVTVDEAVSATSLALAVAISFALVIIAIVIRFVVARSFAPVERMRRTVDAIDPGDLGARVPIRGVDDEVDRLAGTLNGMLDRLEGAQLRQRRFVSDASHELRSPLATIRQHAELVRAHPDAETERQLADVVLDEAERMQYLVDDLLLLARLDERGDVGTRTDLDIDDVLLAEASRVRGATTLNVDTSQVHAARVRGNERLIARAIRNVVDNAARHARSGLAFASHASDTGVVVTIDDDGHGIAEADRESVFDRFVRLDQGRDRDSGGSGLGLAIVRQVIVAHGGSVAVESAPLGGARLIIELPATAS
ncbi:signal transduction histidine kinase [Microbacterium sp. AK009]|uniref:sensor histidine kinase n=1 Tax=Microbacterium sp. AK009 TaxID=2723068 RepID=UPI0015CDEF36|nr:HAMP domain-containing sensor histidine kinase [Microbacterium sp. AK009]NYF17838.1 signal transduction histidine kinase [Microbacterium sp. AK009]